MLKLENDIVHHLERGESLALATIIRRSGSAPRHAGTRMLVTQAMSISGSIGGGQIESEVLAACLPVCRGAPARLLHFDMTGFGPEADIICGGTVEILVERLMPDALPLFRQAAECRRQASFGVWLVDISDPALPRRTFHTDAATLPTDTLAQAQRNRAVCTEIEGRQVYVEPLIHQGIVLLCGGGHVALATGRLAHEIGFEILVVDDRPEYASPSRFPFARTELLSGFGNLAEVCGIGAQHYIVIATRGHSHDGDCLRQALQTNAPYIGMIGSRRKRDALYALLRSEGFPKEVFARVHCPIGLEIGAETPEEIAVSIVSELIAARRGLL